MIQINTTMAFPLRNLVIILVAFLLEFGLEGTNAAFFRRRHHPTGMANLDHYYFTVDPPEPNPMSPTVVRKIKKGARCAMQTSICDGLVANNSTAFIHCCQRHCVDVLGDRFNCGQCGRRCGRGMLCRQGTCTDYATS